MTSFHRFLSTVALASCSVLAIGAAPPTGVAPSTESLRVSAPGGAMLPGANAPTVLYTLDPESVLLSGCFPAPPFACAGLLALYDDFDGSFGLTPIGIDERGFSLFEVSNLALIAHAGDNSIEAIGFGIYRRTFGEDAVQDLTLFVLLEGTPSVFRSHLVPVPDGDDAIDIAVTMNDLQNYDTLMQIVANPGK